MNTPRPIKPIVRLLSAKFLQGKWPQLHIPTRDRFHCPDNDAAVVVLRKPNPNKRNACFFTLAPAPSHNREKAREQMMRYFALGWELFNGEQDDRPTRFVRNEKDPFDILREMQLIIVNKRGCDPFDLRCCAIDLLRRCYTFVEDPGVHHHAVLELVRS